MLPCGRKLLPPPPPPTAAKLEQWKQQLRDYLTAQSLKYTEQRWSIAEQILTATGHLDAQGIVAHVKKTYPNIGVATVYRNIKVLCDAGILQESHQNRQGVILYELLHETHHDHITCLDCGEIFEFENSEIEQLQVQVAQNMDFIIAGHRHVIHAHCAYLKDSAKV